MRRRALYWLSVITMAATVMALGAVGTLRWTLIPWGIRGTVVVSGYQDGTGERLRTIEMDDGRRLVVDRSLIERSGGRDALEGAVLTKQPWQRELVVDDRPVRLGPPAELWEALIALGCVVAGGFWLRARGRRNRRGTQPDKSSPCT